MRIRADVGANYRAVFFDGKTVRQRINSDYPVSSPKYAEIEDVAINNKCFANCSYCYTSALSNGENFGDISDKAKKVWGERELNDRPFQIAIGGAGESTVHPQWVDFVKTVRDLDIIPNFTTNGMHLSKDILFATEKYCGGVAVSYHPHIGVVFHKAMKKLGEINTHLNIHIIIGDDKSFEDLKNLFGQYENDVKYFVILPYQAVGRAVHLETENTWNKTFDWIGKLPQDKPEKFAFGALFYEYLKRNKIDLNIDVYEPELFSGYRIFDDTFMKIRYSSYNPTFKGE